MPLEHLTPAERRELLNLRRSLVGKRGVTPDIVRQTKNKISSLIAGLKPGDRIFIPAGVDCDFPSGVEVILETVMATPSFGLPEEDYRWEVMRRYSLFTEDNTYACLVRYVDNPVATLLRFKKFRRDAGGRILPKNCLVR